jgi:hypothetical protein
MGTLIRRALYVLGLLSTVPLAGCTFDYLNNLDRISLAGGNAVQANLEQSTINPSHRRSYKTEGLGAQGNVIPSKTAASSVPQPTAPVASK